MSNTDSPNNIAPRQLWIMRHAKSSWSDPGMTDFDRPLNHRGQTAAPRVGQRLEDNDMRPDIVLASTARRVRETIERLQSTWDHQAQIVWEKQLYLASVPTLLEHVAALDTAWSRVMLVGHNPGLSDLVMYLADYTIDMPTAAIVMLEGPASPWREALRHRPWKKLDTWTPKDEPTC